MTSTTLSELSLLKSISKMSEDDVLLQGGDFGLLQFEFGGISCNDFGTFFQIH